MEVIQERNADITTQIRRVYSMLGKCTEKGLKPGEHGPTVPNPSRLQLK